MLLLIPDQLASSWLKQIGFDSANATNTVHNDTCTWVSVALQAR